MIFSDFFSDFFVFRDEIFMDFKKIGVLKRKMSPLSRKYYVYLRNMLPQVLRGHNPELKACRQYNVLFNVF